MSSYDAQAHCTQPYSTLSLDTSIIARYSLRVMNYTTDTQEAFEITPEIKVVMEELGLNERAIGVGLSKGYEAQRIDPDLPCETGNIIWAASSHIRAFIAWADREIGLALSDAKQHAGAKQAHAPVLTTKGSEAYRRRVDGEKWAEIGPHAMNNAKAYAKARSLPWPPAQSDLVN